MAISVNRRTFVSGASAVAGAGLLGVTPALAQDATPDAEASPEAPVFETIPPELTSNPTNWAVQGQNLSHTREAQESGVSSETVGTLGVAWTFAVDNTAPFGALTANPIVVDTTVYLQDAVSNVYALDLEGGAELWSNIYDEQIPSGGPNGIAAAYGRLFYGVGGEGEVVSVDAATGELVWSVNIGGPRGEGIDMAPVVHDGVVYISTIPGNPSGFYQAGQRGVIHALDAATGEVLWYFDTTTDNLWGNSRVNSGGGLWHPPAIDENGYLYAGVGNAAPFPGTEDFPNSTSRPGDNDYANSLISIDPATANLRWYINVKPHDLFDLDNQLSPILATVTVDGVDRNLVFSAGKHGLVLAADRDTGEELWRTAVGQHNGNADLQEVPEGESVEVLPGVLGGVETLMAYANGVIYAPVLNLPTWYTSTSIDASRLDLFGGTGELVALDAATGEILWSAAIPTGVFASATVSNDLVFTGGLDGVVRAYSVADGTLVWSAQATAGLNAPFAVTGDYLLVPAGGFMSPSEDSADPAPDRAPGLIAYKVGLA